MSVYPFEPDDSYPISADFAHCCARAAPPISDELAPPQLMASHFECPTDEALAELESKVGTKGRRKFEKFLREVAEDEDEDVIDVESK